MNKFEPTIHICPICKRKCKWYTVLPINPNAPCSEKCRKIQDERIRKNIKNTN